ncbi:MAG: hypothetical protein GY845_25725 [Planctomycetes bacterium]|nr:hypothetical protein [Planctomycetota bacterium]
MKAMQEAMIEMSNLLCEAMGLSERDLDDMNANGVSFNVPGYSIGVRSFPWNAVSDHEWKNMLVVTPSQVSLSNVGYTNTSEERFFPTNWEIVSRGTASIICFPENEAPRILEAVRLAVAEDEKNQKNFKD